MCGHCSLEQQVRQTDPAHKNPKAVVKHIFADVESVHRCIVEDENKKRYILEIGGDKIPLIGETWKICYTHIREDKPTMCTLLEKANE